MEKGTLGLFKGVDLSKVFNCIRGSPPPKIPFRRTPPLNRTPVRHCCQVEGIPLATLLLLGATWQQCQDVTALLALGRDN